MLATLPFFENTKTQKNIEFLVEKIKTQSLPNLAGKIPSFDHNWTKPTRPAEAWDQSAFICTATSQQICGAAGLSGVFRFSFVSIFVCFHFWRDWLSWIHWTIPTMMPLLKNNYFHWHFNPTAGIQSDRVCTSSKNWWIMLFSKWVKVRQKQLWLRKMYQLWVTRNSLLERVRL